MQENEFEEKVTTLLSSDYDGTPLPEEKAKPIAEPDPLPQHNEGI